MGNALSRFLTRINSLDLTPVVQARNQSAMPLGFGGGEAKAAVSSPVNAQSVSAYSLFLAPVEITPRYAWLLYENVAPLAKVIDLIADNVAGLDPLVMVNGEPVSDARSLLEFLDEPGYNRTRQQLIKEMVVQELVTGTCYLRTLGNVRFRDPARLDVLKSFFINPVVGFDMWPASFIYAEGTQGDRFDKVDGHNFRWVSPTGMSELTPIYGMDGNRRGIGLSKLTAIKADVELRMKGTEHNASVMDNGARPSGILNSKTGLTPEQAQALIEQIQATFSGSQNAGKTLVTGGGDMQYTALSLTAKDMDWTNLIKITEDAIVQRFNVPGPLFNNDAQTDNNYETAWNMFYDNAVLPEFKLIWSGIGRMLSARSGLKISFKHDALTNNILARQAMAQAKDGYGAGLLTANEGRDKIGYPAMPGGDFTNNPMQGQVADDYFTDDVVGQPRRIQAPAPQEDDAASAPGRDKSPNSKSIPFT